MITGKIKKSLENILENFEDILKKTFKNFQLIYKKFQKRVEILK